MTNELCGNCGKPIEYIVRMEAWCHVSLKDGSRCEGVKLPEFDRINHGPFEHPVSE